MTQTHHQNADIDPRIERALTAFDAHDVDAMMAEFADGGTFTDPLVDGELSGDALRDYTLEVFEAFPDLRIDVRRVVSTGGEVVAIETTYVGTHEGPMEGLPPTGETIEIPGVTIIDVSDAGITAWRDYFDQQLFADQLGLTFPAIVTKVPKLATAKLRNAVEEL